MKWLAEMREKISSLGRSIKGRLAKPNEVRKGVEEVTDLLRQYNRTAENVAKAVGRKE